MSTDVVTVAANPAIDHTLFVEDLVPGGIHRTARARTTAGGKGVNAARAAKALGAGVVAIAPVGGRSGAYFLELAASEGIEIHPVPIKGPTRTCTLVVSSRRGEATVVNEEGPELSIAACEALVEKALECARSARALVLSGSLPRGAPADLYRRIVESISIPVVLDARGPELLAALPARPDWVHLTAHELAETFSGVEAAPRDEALRRRLLAELVRIGGRNVILTDGPGPVLVEGTSVGSWTLDPPSVLAVNPVGCGDALAGALATFLACGLAPIDSVRAAIAAASASAATEVPGAVDPGFARDLAPSVAFTAGPI